MAQDSNSEEQAIARALRDNLERIKQTSDELHHAVNDIVSACASNRPTNALPPLLRAQTSAASLTAALEVLSRFVAMSLQTDPRSPLEAQITDLVGRTAPEPPTPVAKATPQPRVEPPRPAFEPEPEAFELVEPVPAPVGGADFDGEF